MMAEWDFLNVFGTTDRRPAYIKSEPAGNVARRWLAWVGWHGENRAVMANADAQFSRSA
jgi:hypothetical protein